MHTQMFMYVCGYGLCFHVHCTSLESSTLTEKELRVRHNERVKLKNQRLHSHKTLNPKPEIWDSAATRLSWSRRARTLGSSCLVYCMQLVLSFKQTLNCISLQYLNIGRFKGWESLLRLFRFLACFGSLEYVTFNCTA